MARRPPPPSKPPRQPGQRRDKRTTPAPETTKPTRALAHRLVGMALELAGGLRRAAAGKLTPAEIESLLDIGEEAPDAAAMPEADRELLAQAFALLPERRRAILMAVLQGDAPRRAIARRFGISVKTLDAELSRALQYGLRHLEETRGKGPKR